MSNKKKYLIVSIIFYNFFTILKIVKFSTYLKRLKDIRNVKYMDVTFVKNGFDTFQGYLAVSLQLFNKIWC